MRFNLLISYICSLFRNDDYKILYYELLNDYTDLSEENEKLKIDRNIFIVLCILLSILNIILFILLNT